MFKILLVHNFDIRSHAGLQWVWILHVPASDLSSVVFLLIPAKPMKVCLCVWGQMWLTNPQSRVLCPGTLWLLCVLCSRAAGALGGQAEEGALHEWERHAAERAAGPQRFHVSAATYRAAAAALGHTASVPYLLLVCFPQLMFCMLWHEHHFNYYNTSLFLLFCGFCLGRSLLAVDGWKCLWAHSWFHQLPGIIISGDFSVSELV